MNVPSIGQCAQTACLLEVTARKLGDVHRTCDFGYVEFVDFAFSGLAIGPVLERAHELSVGECVVECIRQTRSVTAANTNLGVVLLLAPLAGIPRHVPIQEGIHAVLDRLTVADSVHVYEAIRLAQPGALGNVEEQDVADEPTLPLREIMALAAERDMVARQYANGFQEVLTVGLPALAAQPCSELAILDCQLRLLCACPDTLIARKYGQVEAMEATRQARRVRELGWPATAESWSAWRKLDEWMRDPQRQRNPGTTADLVTACLFIALRDGTMQLSGLRPWAARPLDSP